MKATGADVVLIDPQFAPKVIAKPEIEDMVDLISSAARQENVDVFHRLCAHASLARNRWDAIRGVPFLGRSAYERLELQLFRQGPCGCDRRWGNAAREQQAKRQSHHCRNALMSSRSQAKGDRPIHLERHIRGVICKNRNPWIVAGF